MIFLLFCREELSIKNDAANLITEIKNIIKDFKKKYAILKLHSKNSNKLFITFFNMGNILVSTNFH